MKKTVISLIAFGFADAVSAVSYQIDLRRNSEPNGLEIQCGDTVTQLRPNTGVMLGNFAMGMWNGEIFSLMSNGKISENLDISSADISVAFDLFFSSGKCRIRAPEVQIREKVQLPDFSAEVNNGKALEIAGNFSAKFCKVSGSMLINGSMEIWDGGKLSLNSCGENALLIDGQLRSSGTAAVDMAQSHIGKIINNGLIYAQSGMTFITPDFFNGELGQIRGNDAQFKIKGQFQNFGLVTLNHFSVNGCRAGANYVRFIQGEACYANQAELNCTVNSFGETQIGQLSGSGAFYITGGTTKADEFSSKFANIEAVNGSLQIGKMRGNADLIKSSNGSINIDDFGSDGQIIFMTDSGGEITVENAAAPEGFMYSDGSGNLSFSRFNGKAVISAAGMSNIHINRAESIVMMTEGEAESVIEKAAVKYAYLLDHSKSIISETNSEFVYNQGELRQLHAKTGVIHNKGKLKQSNVKVRTMYNEGELEQSDVKTNLLLYNKGKIKQSRVKTGIIHNEGKLEQSDAETKTIYNKGKLQQSQADTGVIYNTGEVEQSNVRTNNVHNSGKFQQSRAKTKTIVNEGEFRQFNAETKAICNRGEFAQSNVKTGSISNDGKLSQTNAKTKTILNHGTFAQSNAKTKTILNKGKFAQTNTKTKTVYNRGKLQQSQAETGMIYNAGDFYQLNAKTDKIRNDGNMALAGDTSANDLSNRKTVVFKSGNHGVKTYDGQVYKSTLKVQGKGKTSKIKSTTGAQLRDGDAEVSINHITGKGTIEAAQQKYNKLMIPFFLRGNVDVQTKHMPRPEDIPEHNQGYFRLYVDMDEDFINTQDTNYDDVLLMLNMHGHRWINQNALFQAGGLDVDSASEFGNYNGRIKLEKRLNVHAWQITNSVAAIARENGRWVEDCHDWRAHLVYYCPATYYSTNVSTGIAVVNGDVVLKSDGSIVNQFSTVRAAGTFNASAGQNFDNVVSYITALGDGKSSISAKNINNRCLDAYLRRGEAHASGRCGWGFGRHTWHVDSYTAEWITQSPGSEITVGGDLKLNGQTDNFGSSILSRGLFEGNVNSRSLFENTAVLGSGGTLINGDNIRCSCPFFFVHKTKI